MEFGISGRQETVFIFGRIGVLGRCLCSGPVHSPLLRRESHDGDHGKDAAGSGRRVWPSATHGGFQ